MYEVDGSESISLSADWFDGPRDERYGHTDHGYGPVSPDQPAAKIPHQRSLALQAVDPSVGVDPGCNNHGVLAGTDATFVWHHGNTGDAVHDDGCDHAKQGKFGHQGLISVTVSDDKGEKCSATYGGTNSSDANAAMGLDAASAASCTGAKP